MSCDVFISYAHLDNDNAEGEGFVSRLIRYIKKEGSGLLGRPITVWNDTEIKTGTKWEDEIWDQLWLSRVFVPVISPAWLKSGWTQKEWNEKVAQVTDDFSLGNRSRILPIGYRLTPGHVKDLGDVQSLQLKHKLSDRSDLATELLPFAEDLRDVLGLLDDEMRPLNTIVKPQQIKGKVFLGIAFTQQMNRWRRSLRQHLRVRDFETVEFDWKAGESAEQIRVRADEQLKDCDAAVHFLDIRGRHRIKGEEQGPSPIEIQCVAAEKRTETGIPFTQISWCGPKEAWDYEGEFEGERSYWDFVKNRHEPYKRATADELKQEILKRLEHLRAPSRAVPAPMKPSACIVYEPADEKPAQEIEEYLKKRGWAVSRPSPELIPLDFQKEELNNFLFYWGTGKRPWYAQNLQELVRGRAIVKDPAPDDPSHKNFGLYLAPAWKPAKDAATNEPPDPPFEWRANFIAMGKCNPWSPALLERFVKEVETSFRSQASRISPGSVG